MTGPVLRRTESHFRGEGGEVLFRRSWLPADPRRAVVLVHGYAEHSGRYEHVGRWFAARGCAVHGWDHRGHGRSGGTRCHVDSFDQFLADMDTLLALVGEEHPQLPITLVGHSMGGLITLAFLLDRKPLVSSVVTSGPALHLGEGVSRGRVLAARLLRRLLPRVTLGSGLDPSGLSRDPEVVRGYLEDPHVHRAMTASLGAELLDRVPDVAARAHEVAVPLLMLHGEEDALCEVAGSRDFFAGVRSPGSRLKVYPELLHEIFNEPEQEQVFQDVWDWLGELSE